MSTVSQSALKARINRRLDTMPSALSRPAKDLTWPFGTGRTTS
jgi:hypothetical protein